MAACEVAVKLWECVCWTEIARRLGVGKDGCWVLQEIKLGQQEALLFLDHDQACVNFKVHTETCLVCKLKLHDSERSAY